MFKRDKDNGHDTCQCKFQNSFLIFSNICYKYTLKLPHRDNFKLYLQHMSFHKMGSIISFLNMFSTTFVFFAEVNIWK